MDNKLKKIHELLCKVSSPRTINELELLFAEYYDVSDDDYNTVIADIQTLCNELISLRNGTKIDASASSAQLTAQQLAEFAEADRIISQNLFDYHFQPIVDAQNGEIFAYEALMRPVSDICLSPYHIIRFAEHNNRLNDIERATFLNVLKLIAILDNNYDHFKDKRIFINSIPKTSLSEKDRSIVNELLSRYSDRVVVEMTEQGELDDSELSAIKNTYSDLGVKIAIDDYGTGYANAQNLLRYMPDYVKIDRSLLSNIHNDNKKRHFVREIINFCHDNGILALAEGVETSDELHTVILLGADLVQGYYTARPTRTAISSITYEVKQEMIRYRHELEDGRKLQIYTADGNERIVLDRQIKNGYTSVLIGNSCNDVILSGNPGIETSIRIEIGKNFKGCVTLENVNIVSDKNRPCISLGENCDVNLIFVGNNKLNKGGIRVPESSRLVCSGEGDLSIFVDGFCFYGIGNDGVSKHGELVFEQGVFIENKSASGICIGSGLGGSISIKQGRYSFKMGGYTGVAIGAMDADTNIDIFACDMNMDLTLQHGVAIGSLNGNTQVDITHSSVGLYLSGSDIAGVGTINGSLCRLNITEANAAFNIVADNCSAIAALNGDTDFSISKATLKITTEGDNALAIGSSAGRTELSLVNSDSSVTLVTSCNWRDRVNKNDIEISGGRTRFIINNEEYFYN